jgi:DNA-binding transcriptional LysR family regulator
MNIDLEYYRTFYVVANTGNITRAANVLHTSQPAVTQAIKKLENSLNGSLFVRTKRGVSLTEEGKEFYKYIKQAMDFISSAENKFTELTNLEVGSIKIGIGTTLTREFLLPYLEEFHNNYPNIKIDILTHLTTDLIPMLRNGLVDIIILHLPFKTPNDIKIVKCRDITDAFVVNKNYIELTKQKIPLADLNKYPLILQSTPSNTRVFLDAFASSNGVELKPSMNLASYSLVIEFTKIGYGIGFATLDNIEKELKEETLYALNVIPNIPKRGIGYAVKKDSVPNFATQKLIKIIMHDVDKN